MSTIIIETDNHTMKKVITFLNSNKVKFEIKEEFDYKKEFVKKMDESIEDAKAGRVRSLSLDEIWK